MTMKTKTFIWIAALFLATTAAAQPDYKYDEIAGNEVMQGMMVLHGDEIFEYEFFTNWWPHYIAVFREFAPEGTSSVTYGVGDGYYPAAKEATAHFMIRALKRDRGMLRDR